MMAKEVIEKKIKYMLGLGFSDLMQDGRTVSFSILIPVQFTTEEEATAGQNYFFARMECLDEEVVINIYGKNIDADKNNKIVKTIRWEDYYSYECSILKEECIGKCGIDAMLDEEPCSEKFDVIFKKLVRSIKTTSFSMQCLSYWIRPAFESLELLQFNKDTR